jgi:hypothetical protein
MSPILHPSEKRRDGDKGIGTTVESLQKWGHNNAIVIVMASTLFLPKVVSKKVLLTTGDVHLGRTDPGSSLTLLLRSWVRVQPNGAVARIRVLPIKVLSVWVDGCSVP